MTSDTEKTKNGLIKKLPVIPSDATVEEAPDGGKIYHFIITILDPEEHIIHISKDQSRVVEEVSVVQEEKKLKRYREETLNGVKDGIQESYYRDGRLMERVKYVAGEKSGPFERYSIRTGKLEERGQYKNGKREGKWEFFTGGKYLKEIYYSNGKYDGSFKRFTVHNGKRELSERKYYINGNLSGIREYFLGGKLYSKTGYLDGKKDGVYIQYLSENPSVVGEYSKGKKTGEWTFYLIDNLVLKTENYKDGKKNGICKECYYHKSEKTGLEIDYVVETNYKDGLQDGEFPYEEFDKDGNLVLKGSLINGKKEGVWKHYANNELITQDFYSNGELISTIQSNIPVISLSKEPNIPQGPKETEIEQSENYTYKYELINGQRNGLYQEFDCNDHLIREGYYSNGKRVGVWKSYDEEGSLCSETPFDNGVISGIIKGYVEGELVDRTFVPEQGDLKKCPYERYFKGEITEQGECAVDREFGADPCHKKVIQKFRNGKPEEP